MTPSSCQCILRLPCLRNRPPGPMYVVLHGTAARFHMFQLFHSQRPRILLSFRRGRDLNPGKRPIFSFHRPARIASTATATEIAIARAKAETLSNATRPNFEDRILMSITPSCIFQNFQINAAFHSFFFSTLRSENPSGPQRYCAGGRARHW